MPKPNKTWILKERIKYLEDQVESLTAQLDVEKDASKIDRILDKEKYTSLKVKLDVQKSCGKIDGAMAKMKYDKMYRTTLQISRDFLKYVEAHPDDDDNDSDSDSDSDITMINLVSIDDFFNRSPTITDEEIEEVRECFGI